MNRVDYAGPGGTCEGMRMLGLRPVGIEWDAAACATRAAAGHLTIRADLATYRPLHAPGSVRGYWASPPCQTFSAAGKGKGRQQLEQLVSIIDREAWDEADQLDPRTRHVVDAARAAITLRPEWVGMEQVPPALPVFGAIARRLRAHGYTAWVGVVNCANYGIPQTRKRVILMGSRVRAVRPPDATHSAIPADSLFGTTERWVSMADALGWPTWRAGVWEFVNGAQEHATRRPMTSPSPAILASADNGDSRFQFAGVEPGTRPIKLTVRDALILQSFRPDYPVQGTKTKQFEQVGNAVPPLLAAHVVAALVGVPFAPELEQAA